jgi:hypothetical protein
VVERYMMNDVNKEFPRKDDQLRTAVIEENVSTIAQHVTMRDYELAWTIYSLRCDLTATHTPSVDNLLESID